VFAVGFGAIFHYDGASWSRQLSNAALSAVWGRSGTDVYAVGAPFPVSTYHYDGTTWLAVPYGGANLSGVWGRSGEVIVVGVQFYGGYPHDPPRHAVIGHYDGSQWTTYRWSIMSGVWASSATNAYAVGSSGGILHYDGTGWQVETSGTGQDLTGVWGSAANDVFAVGSGIILHNDGTGWTTQLSPSMTLIGVWGTSSRDVYAISAFGTLQHYDGAAWTTQQIGITPGSLVQAIWASSGSDIYALGSGNVVWHFDGSRWSGDEITWPDTSHFTIPIMTSVWGSSAGDVLAVGSRSTCLPLQCADMVVARRCGNSWIAEVPGKGALMAISGSSAGDVYAVGDFGTILRRDGRTWVPQPVVTSTTLTGVWITSDGTLFAVGAGTILRANP
jgi:hypothetical protein